MSIKRKIATTFILICMFLSAGFLTVNAAESTTYTYTISLDGSWTRTQDAYRPGKIYLENIGMNAPEDLFIRNGLIYVSDTGNARVVIYDMNSGGKRVVGEDFLVEPRGIYVTENGTMYIADSGADAVFILDSNGIQLQKITRPSDSNLFSELTAFSPKGVVVTKEGNIFVCGDGTYEGLMQFDTNGVFQGFFAANKKHLTLTETIEDLLLSDNLKQELAMRRPRSIMNIDVSDRDLIYTVTQTDEYTYAWQSARKKNENAIKLFNMAGINILSRNTYMTDEWNFVDVAAGQNGGCYALTYTGLLYEYDSEGNVVFSFGGRAVSSERSGLFTYASAIDTDSNGFIYVLDRERGLVQSFYPTDYAVKTHQAIYDLENGNYSESEKNWQDLLRLNSMSYIAHYGYGKALLHQQRYEEALQEFKTARDTENYSDAFWELRDKWLSDNIVFLFVPLALFLLCSIVISIIRRKKPGFLRRKTPQKAKGRFVTDLLYLKTILRHPIDGFYYLKCDQHGSVIAATVLYFVAALFFVIKQLYSGIIFKSPLSEIPPLLLLVVFLGVALLWNTGNYMVATINEGESSFKHIYIMTAYALAPYLVITPFQVAATHILTLNEEFVINLAWTVALVWSGVLIFVGISNTHNFTFPETVKNVFLTLFFMIMAIIVIAVLYILWLQVVEFFADVLLEVKYHVQY
ncbi:MAG: YIP1 family protein [Acutalibacteraceae bacterium]